MVKMTVLIYPPLLAGGFDNEPMECVVEGKDESTTILDLKNDLDEVVIRTLKNNKYGNGGYLVEIQIEENAEHFDNDGPVYCECDVENEKIEWGDDCDAPEKGGNDIQTYFDGKPIPKVYIYANKTDGGKTVTLDVVKHDGYEWAVLYRYRDGDVLAMKLPSTGSPVTEPLAWEQLRFSPAT